MKEKIKIGILGATGTVGKGALEMFGCCQKEYQYLLGGRNKTRLEQVANIYLKNIPYQTMLIDVTDKEKCMEFCRLCDIIIDCSGPVCELGFYIVESCLDLAIPYVTVSGDKIILDHIEDYRKDKNTPCVLACGLSPGLTELLAFYMAKQYDEIEEIEEYLGGKSYFSQSAIKDILAALILHSDEEVGMGRKIENGQLVECSSKWKIQEYPKPFGKQVAIPMISDIYQEAIHLSGCKNASFYDSMICTNLIFPKLSNKKEKDSIEELVKDVKQKCEDNRESVTYIMINSKGVEGGKEKSLEWILYYDGDGERFSGILTASVLMMLLDGQLNIERTAQMYQCVSGKKLLDRLVKAEKIQLKNEEE